MSDAALLASWDKLMRSVEIPYAMAVAKEKDRYIQASSDEFTRNRALTDQLFSDHLGMMGIIAEQYQKVAIRLAIREALFGKQKSRTAPRMKATWDALWLYLVHYWISTYGAHRVRTAARTTRQDMQRILDIALSAEVEFNPVAVAIQLLRAKQLSAPRADVIARSEVHAAMMFASQEGAAKLSRDEGVVMLKRWVPVEDERTRTNHAAMKGTAAIPLESDFLVGGERMARPGDPSASAENVIRCRCVCAYEVAE